MTKDIKKFYYAIMLLIVVFGLGLRLIGLDKGIWLDEFISIDKISEVNFIQALRGDNQPPTYFLLLRLWSTFSRQEAFLRVPSIIFGIASIVLFMIWLKPISPYAGLLGGFMMASMPIFIRYSQEIRGYSLLVFATVLSFYCSYKIASKNVSIWYYLLAISLTIASTTHLIGLMVLPSVGLYLLFNHYQLKAKIPWPKVIVVFTIPLFLYFLIYIFFFQNLYGQNWWMPPFSSQLFVSQFRYVFGIDKLIFTSSFLEIMSKNLAMLFRLGLTSLIIITSFILLLFGSWKKSFILLLSAFTYWLQIILFSVLFVPIFWYRTLLLGVVPFIGFVSIQSTSIKNKLIRAFSIFGIVIIFIILASGWFLSESRNPSEQWRQAAQYLISETESTDIIMFYPRTVRGPIRYYFDALPEQNEITLDLEFDSDELASLLSNRISQLGHGEQTISIFLVVRESLNVQKRGDKYDSLLGYLEFISENKSIVGDYGIIQIYLFENVDQHE